MGPVAHRLGPGGQLRPVGHGLAAAHASARGGGEGHRAIRRLPAGVERHRAGQGAGDVGDLLAVAVGPVPAQLGSPAVEVVAGACKAVGGERARLVVNQRDRGGAARGVCRARPEAHRVGPGLPDGVEGHGPLLREGVERTAVRGGDMRGVAVAIGAGACGVAIPAAEGVARPDDARRRRQVEARPIGHGDRAEAAVPLVRVEGDLVGDGLEERDVAHRGRPIALVPSGRELRRLAGGRIAVVGIDPAQEAVTGRRLGLDGRDRDAGRGGVHAADGRGVGHGTTRVVRGQRAHGDGGAGVRVRRRLGREGELGGQLLPLGVEVHIARVGREVPHQGARRIAGPGVGGRERPVLEAVAGAVDTRVRAADGDREVLAIGEVPIGDGAGRVGGVPVIADGQLVGLEVDIEGHRVVGATPLGHLLDLGRAQVVVAVGLEADVVDVVGPVGQVVAGLALGQRAVAAALHGADLLGHAGAPTRLADGVDGHVAVHDGLVAGEVHIADDLVGNRHIARLPLGDEGGRDGVVVREA